MQQTPENELLRGDKGEPASVSAWVGPKGDTLRLRGHFLEIPEGAVTERTLFTMEEPSSDLIKVTLRANDQEHYEFTNGIHPTLTLSYAERARDAQPQKGFSLVIYKVDECSNAVIKQLNSKHDNNGKRVSATLETLSGYVIGNGRAQVA